MTPKVPAVELLLAPARDAWLRRHGKLVKGKMSEEKRKELLECFRLIDKARASIREFLQSCCQKHTVGGCSLASPASCTAVALCSACLAAS